jgi:ATP-dependent Clp protease ATP-binding subunit ClpC
LDKFIVEIDVRLTQKDISLMLTAEARNYLINKGYDSAYGARPLRRVVQKELEDVISEKLLLGEISNSSVIVVDMLNDALDFSHSSKLIPDILEFPS